MKRAECYTFLGMCIDAKLNWKAHIDYICKKVSKFIAILHKLKFSLSIKSLKLLYNSYLILAIVLLYGVICINQI